MKTPLLQELESKQITLSVTEQGKLSASAPDDALTPDVLEVLRLHKAELIAALSAAPAPFYRTIENTVPPRHCLHCNYVGIIGWKLNPTFNRWQCPKCQISGMLNHARVIVAETGQDAITEAVAFLDEIKEQGCFIRYYENGQCGLTVPPAWDNAQFDQIARGVMARDMILRRLIPARPGAPVAYEPEPEPETTTSEQEPPAPESERHTEPLPTIAAPAPETATVKRWPVSTEHAALSNIRLVYHVTSHGKTTRESLALGESVVPFVTLFDQALAHNLRVLWAVPGSNYSNLAPGWAGAASETFKRERTASYAYQGWDVKVTVTRAERGRDVIVNLVARRDGKQIILTCPEYSAYDWRVSQVGQLDEVTILGAIHYLHGALSIRSLNANPGVQGRELISRFVKAEYLAIPDLDYRAFIKPDMGYGYDLAFRRLPDESEQGALYVVAVDKRSAYLGACTGAKLGTGTPRHMQGAPDFRPDVKLPGIWHVKITGDLPRVNPIYRDSQGNLQRWLTSALLAWLYKNNVSVEVLEGWQWDEGHRTLETWAMFLWNAREDLRMNTATYPNERARALARYSVKRIATAGVGILANEKAYEYAPALFRPDWQRTIPELAAARIAEQVHNVFNAYGVWPLIIATDAVYYLTSTPDIRAAFPGKFEKSEGLGGWQYKVPPLAITPDVWNLINDSGYSAGTLARKLETLAKGDN